MKDSDLVVFGTYYSDADAYIAKGVLETNGVPCIGVGLQLHTLVKTVYIKASHHCTLSTVISLLFGDGRHRSHFEARTMDAILDSRPHKYLYMCAKEDFSGRHNFASDYATHQASADGTTTGRPIALPLLTPTILSHPDPEAAWPPLCAGLTRGRA